MQNDPPLVNDRPRPFSLQWLRRVVLGNPIPNSQSDESRLPKILALPVFSSDAISSVAYATQEIVLALGAAGYAAAAHRGLYAHYTWGVVLAIVTVLAIVAISYRQTIFAYPSGGGSYIVSRENLGAKTGLVAAAALLIDYVLTVAVSIASGVQNLVGTPALHFLARHVVLVCIVLVVLLTIANLRGLKQAGALFAIPTYLFIALSLTMVVLGSVGRAVGWQTHPEAVNQNIPAAAVHDLKVLGIVVILRAFANGCSAMTGVEAISNGIPAFQRPESPNAAKTLLWMAAILGALFVGISYLATSLHVVYWEHQGDSAPAVIDQLSSAVFGRTGGGAILYYAMQSATAAILILAANTSFADFPRLTSIVAGDGYLPYDMMNRGDRLVFSEGIVLLGVFAALLLYVFKGNVDRLIPLYALGVFAAFTLSQTGMVVHWRRNREDKWAVKAVINAIGALATGLVFCVVLVEKAPEGAWMVVVSAALLVCGFHLVHGFYDRVGESLGLGEGEKPEIGAPPTPAPQESDAPKGAPPPEVLLRNHVVVLVNHPHRGVVSALRYACLLSQDFEPVYVAIDPDKTDAVLEEWKQHFPNLKLTVLDAPYRSLIQPVLDHIEQKRRDWARSEATRNTPPANGVPEVDTRYGPRDIVTVVLPEYYTGTLWGMLLQRKAAMLLKLALLNRDDVALTDVRYHVRL